MTTIETLQTELDIYKRDLEKLEEEIDKGCSTKGCSKMDAVTGKYLDGMNRVLEVQTELRSMIQRNHDELDIIQDKCLVLSLYAETLKEAQVLDEVRKIKDYFENQKDIKLYDFVFSTKKTLSMLVTVTYIYGASLVALVFQLIAEFLKG